MLGGEMVSEEQFVEAQELMISYVFTATLSLGLNLGTCRHRHPAPSQTKARVAQKGYS